MRNLFAISGLLVTALTAACEGASSPPKATTDSGLSDGAAGAGKDTARAPDSVGDAMGTGADASTADLSGAVGAGGMGGRTVVGAGGSGGAAGSDALSASGGAEPSDGPPAKGGTGATDGPAATGGAGGAGLAGTTSSGGAPSSAGTTSAAGASGTAGNTASAGRSGSTGASAGKTATAGTSGSAGTSGGSTGIASPADNVVAATVDFGLPNIGYLNGLFVTVTICVPGTSQCQTVDHLLVDTGSTGVRVLKSVLPLSLPAWTNDSGVALAECAQFVSGYTWGPLYSADVKIAGEQASGLAIQVIEESTYPVPSACSAVGVDNSTADTLRANGIFGIASLLQDCGSACAAAPGRRSANPGMYYACSSAKTGGCQVAAVPTTKQLVHPVSLFNQDNNGTIIQLPTISANGAASVTGALIFGIGTRDNNGLGQATVLPLDQYGEFVTKYPSTGTGSRAFIDSGSNALYFPTSGSTRIATCAKPYTGYYCPSSTLNLSATYQDSGGTVTLTVNFSIANAVSLFSHANNVAYSNLGGTAAVGGYFDWGLPFYFGRNVYTSIEGQSTSVGTELFVAF
ncbi:MAG: DUF3443 family protein [Polyangia bacterium]